MYEKSVADLRRRMSQEFSGLRPKSFGGQAPDIRCATRKGRLQYLLWMCCRVLEMDDPIKATSWIGWMSREAEVLGLIDDNLTTRNVRRRDLPKVRAAAAKYFAIK